MKNLFVITAIFASVITIDAANTLRGRFIWEKCENWRNLQLRKDGSYRLTESFLGAPPHIVDGTYKVSGKKVILSIHKCHVTYLKDFDMTPEKFKEFEESLCSRRFGPASCALSPSDSKDYLRELRCTQLPDEKNEKRIQFDDIRFRERRKQRTDNTLVDCFMENPYKK